MWGNSVNIMVQCLLEGRQQNETTKEDFLEVMQVVFWKAISSKVLRWTLTYGNKRRIFAAQKSVFQQQTVFLFWAFWPGKKDIIVVVVVVVVVVDFWFIVGDPTDKVYSKGPTEERRKGEKGQKIEIWEDRINWLNHYGMNYNAELEKLYTAINVANCKRNELRINKKKIEERLFESWLWKCWYFRSRDRL